MNTMDVMEKLVEMLNGIIDGGFKWNSYNYESGEQLNNDEIASHLIANGVTVQEWISVSEPPKEYRDEYGELIPFLVCVEGTDYPFRAMYDGKTWGDGIFAIPVKWWMHLPAPPKEKERKDGDGNV